MLAGWKSRVCQSQDKAMLGLAPSRFIVPPECAENAVKLLELANELQGEGKTPLEYEVLPLKVGEDFTLPSGGGLIIRPFKTCHTIASQGYIVYNQRRKLKEELAGRSQDEIRELRQSGEEVTNTFMVPEIAFTGDTTAALMEQDGLEDVFKAKLLIMELTFIDESVSLEQAREKGHMHIIELVANAHRFQNEAILLIHFSARYSRAQILQLLEERLPPALRAKCIPFLNGFQ